MMSLEFNHFSNNFMWSFNLETKILWWSDNIFFIIFSLPGRFWHFKFPPKDSETYRMSTKEALISIYFSF